MVWSATTIRTCIDWPTRMTDSQWALLAGFAIVSITRVIDVFLPKGYMSKWAAKHLIKEPEDDTPDDEQDT
jgi:hypothetical protein